MSMNESSQRITDEDVKSATTVRRSFLGRLGLAAGLVGIAGMSQSCGGEEASSSDVTQPSKVESHEHSDSDAAPEAKEEHSDSDAAPEEKEEHSDSDGDKK